MDKLKANKRDFPMKIKIGFGKVFDAFREQLKADNSNKRALDILALEEKYPELSSGVDSFEELKKYSPQVDTVLQPLFSSGFGDNEIKYATVPFHRVAFKTSEKYEKLVQAAGKDFSPNLLNLTPDEFYIMGCNLISTHFYGRDLGFQREFHCIIPDEKGMDRNYRILYNTEFIEIEKGPKAPDLNDADFDELLESFNYIETWKEKFPPESYIFKGFVIATPMDVTTDIAISDLKTDLLGLEVDMGFRNTDFTRIFKSIFNLKDLKIGFADYNDETESFERVLFKEIGSFLLHGEKRICSMDALCSASYYTLFKQKELYIVT